MTFTIRSQALRDIAEAIQYYVGEEASRAAERFAEAVDAAYDVVIESPFRYPADRDGVRQKPVLGFPFSVLYSVQGDEIVVLSIRHHKRKPGFWRKRM